MGSLQELSLYNCYTLKALPEGIPPRILALSAALAILAQIDRDISSSILLTCSLSEGFGDLPSLEDLDMNSCHALAKNEGTYAILSKICTLSKLSLYCCDMESLPEGSP